ncbi:Carbohydrate esterase family 1 protein [Teratosphaeria destructans]|uniref:feruloyl esterase n=1 Tax=Teratosphaeria destructans TaxID=418781 RepID=A0A9W7SNV8_9PEZI|nr:Carbohydrate esterase family 1 protein [Teratosphaeria destructans]
MPGYHFKDPHGNFSIVSGNLTRYYSVQVPKDYDATKRYPLIFDYHGNTDTSTQQRNNSLYFQYTNDYLVVYPQGYDRHWEGPKYAVPGVDDLQFTTDLLAHIKSKYCVDDNRTYASGKSNGGGFVDTLACSDQGDPFAAFAMASAALYTDLSLDSCSKRRAILESHGDIDTVVAYTGRNCSAPGLSNAALASCKSSGSEPDIDQWVSWWGQRDCGAHAKPQYVTDQTGYNITTYSCGPWTDVVVHYQVFDLGHCWPSAYGNNTDALTQSASQNCSGDRVLDYTPVVLDFFSRWTLEKAP